MKGERDRVPSDRPVEDEIITDLQREKFWEKINDSPDLKPSDRRIIRDIAEGRDKFPKEKGSRIASREINKRPNEVQKILYELFRLVRRNFRND